MAVPTSKLSPLFFAGILPQITKLNLSEKRKKHTHLLTHLNYHISYKSNLQDLNKSNLQDLNNLVNNKNQTIWGLLNPVSLF